MVLNLDIYLLQPLDIYLLQPLKYILTNGILMLLCKNIKEIKMALPALWWETGRNARLRA